MKGVTTFQSPDLSQSDNIYLTKESSNSYTETILHIYTTQKIADYEAHGLYIKFDDGTIFKRPGKSILCSYLDTERGYLYNTLITLDDILFPITPYQTKKIVKIQIADKDINVPDEFATKFKAWANCIVGIK